MAQSAGKRSTMSLYISYDDPYSHRVRIVLAEKGIHAEIFDIASQDVVENFLEISPYGKVPVIIDRDLILYEANVISEYLDERYPHPPLLPVYPVARAKSRQMIYRIERDWYQLLHTIEKGYKNEANAAQQEEAKTAQKKLEDSLSHLDLVFSGKPYFMNEEFTLVDCCIAALLWRLDCLSVKMNVLPESILNYKARIFKRPSLKAISNETEFGVKV